MAYSRVTKIGDGVSTQFTVNFALDYINTAYVTARVGTEVDGLGDPVYRAITFLSTNLLEIAGPPAGIGVNVLFERTVPKDSLIVNYSDGDVLDEENLDTSQKQVLMAVQEVLDGRFSTMTENLDMGGFKPVNVGEPTAASDAATKGYVDLRTQGLSDIIPEITTVAGIAPEVVIVAGVADKVSTVADNVTDITNFSDVYLGPHPGTPTEPTTRNDGTPLQSGDLYFSLSEDTIKVRTSDGEWRPSTAQSLNMHAQSFVGDGVTKSFALDVTPVVAANVLVWLGNSRQRPVVDYSVSGLVLTFVDAPAMGISIDTLVVATISELFAPSDGSVTDDTVAVPATPADGVQSTKLRYDPNATGPAIRTVQDALRDRHDLRDYAGLDLTGVNDNASLLANAFLDSASNGTVLNVPAGLIATGSTVNIPEGANFSGVSLPAKGFNTTPAANDGMTWFHFGHTGVGFHLIPGLVPNAHRSRSLRKFGTYRTQPTPGVTTYTPTNHNWDVRGEGVNDITIDEWNMLNPTLGLSISGSAAQDCGSARITLGRIWGQPLIQGVSFEHCYDIVKLDQVHFWPMWALNTKVLEYTNANAFAIVTGRNDNPQIDQVFTFAYQRALFFVNSSTLSAGVPGGATANFQVGSIQADSCETGLVIDSAANGVTGTISDYVAWGSQYVTAGTPRAFNVAGANASLYLGSLRTSGSATTQNRQLGVISGANSSVRIGRSATYQAGAGYPHFEIAAGTRLEFATSPDQDGSGSVFVQGAGIAGGAVRRGFIPSIASSAGALTSATVSGIYRIIGDELEYTVEISVPDNGSGSGTLNIGNFPFNAASLHTVSGHEAVATGRGLGGIMYGGTNTLIIKQYDTGYPVINGFATSISGRYKIA